jgi:phage shock protein PspC (stress-responsive transcriptional regulator)
MVRTPGSDQDRDMTQTPQQEQDQVRSGVDTDHLRDYEQLRRSVDDRKIAGVAGGLGRHLNIDPTILRVLFVVLCFFGGAGFVLYGAAWLIVPEEGQARGNIETSAGTRTALLVIAAVVAGLLVLGDSWGGFRFPWPLAIVALLVFLVLRRRDHPTTLAAPDESASAPAWAAPVPPSPAPRRKQGPLLFGFTLAVVAVALGALGLYDVAGGHVTPSAYPALALAVIGVVLVVGAWVGRAGGLILLGVVAALVLAVTALANPAFDSGRAVSVEATSAGQVADTYFVPAGRMYVDLSQVRDVGNLDGRTVDIGARAGEIIVVVPADVRTVVSARVSGPGEIDTPQRNGNGFNVRVDDVLNTGVGSPVLDLRLHLYAGHIEVRQS